MHISLSLPTQISAPPKRFRRRLFLSEMAKKVANTPQWVGLLLGRKFFDLCDDHKELRRSEVNIFCIECSESMCPHCLVARSSPHRGRHDGHRFLQIRRYVYQDVIRVHDMQKYVDCSRVQSFIVNGARVVLLNPKRQTKPAAQGSGSGPFCGICQRAVPEPNRYCSIACKVEDEIKASDSNSNPSPESNVVDSASPKADHGDAGCGGGDLLSPSPQPSEAASPDQAKNPPKKRGVSRRKGVPRRAQLF